MSEPNSEGSSPINPASLRILMRLVTVLTATMILGLLVIVAVFVTRFFSAPDLALPEQLILPEGAQATAFTQGRDWLAVVTADGHILIYDRDGGGPRQVVVID